MVQRRAGARERHQLGRWLVGLLVWAGGLPMASAVVGSPAAHPLASLTALPSALVPADGASLRAQYTALQAELAQNAFKQPLVVRSNENDGKILGEVFAVVDYSLTQVIQGLDSPVHWCGIMILHINTKYCSAKPSPQGMQIAVHIGKKTPENLIYTRPLVLNYLPYHLGPDYLNIGLMAKEGPMGTSDYQIVLEAVALSGDRSFLHLSYAYKVNMMGKLALQTYLGTAGRNKVGFSVLQPNSLGPPVLVGGVRGLVERNTMRYYLAINAYLAAERLPPQERAEARLLNWILATERYPVQLQEVDRASYLAMKRAELIRQQTLQ